MSPTALSSPPRSSPLQKHVVAACRKMLDLNARARTHRPSDIGIYQRSVARARYRLDKAFRNWKIKTLRQSPQSSPWWHERPARSHLTRAPAKPTWGMAVHLFNSSFNPKELIRNEYITDTAVDRSNRVLTGHGLARRAERRGPGAVQAPLGRVAVGLLGGQRVSAPRPGSATDPRPRALPPNVPSSGWDTRKIANPVPSGASIYISGWERRTLCRPSASPISRSHPPVTDFPVHFLLAEGTAQAAEGTPSSGPFFQSQEPLLVRSPSQPLAATSSHR